MFGSSRSARAGRHSRSGAEPTGNAYFAFYLLAMGTGRPRTFERLREMLTDAGFADVALRPAPIPMLASVITARRV